MIKRFIVFLLLLSFSALGVGCSQETVVDMEKFNYINAYVNEILPAIEETRFDFNLWVVDMGSVEKREWLEMDAKRIRDIEEHYCTEDFPSYEEIVTWIVPVLDDNNNNWIIQGDQLAPALEQVEAASKELALLIEQIMLADDELFLSGKSEEMGAVLNRAEEAAEKLRTLFHRDNSSLVESSVQGP